MIEEEKKITKTVKATDTPEPDVEKAKRQDMEKKQAVYYPGR